MIYRELKVYETPLGLKKTSRADLCERKIIGHVIYKIDLLPDMFKVMSAITETRGLEANYPQIRADIVTALCGDCPDGQYTAALTRLYENSPFFQAYINYHYIMRRDEIKLTDLIVPLVNRVNSAGDALREASKGIYMAEHDGYLYILDGYKSALEGCGYVEIR